MVCRSFQRKQKYLIENAYGNGDATKIIHNLLDEYTGDRKQLQKMLYEWIYQPGAVVLFMERNGEGVVITQTRFTSTFFDKELRDESTRFTIPLFCKIDGQPRTFVFDSGMESLSIPLSPNSTITIEDDYGHLFGIYRKKRSKSKNFIQEQRWSSY
ncbi:hypothetical protein PENTCL1PPCAC_5761 [Pristionchus entomophagus]|uniref:Peptidase M1 membrane alanine aminopeptidase domain-containing protein n=1 Tax=Pristionchus entomophagus TaxID=358040 RepID=A0AAV5SVQ7_9BILA|nr:hypothetical protein PENTCL1PPCAC_5761 [Pristionchus entomophagus]